MVNKTVRDIVYESLNNSNWERVLKCKYADNAYTNLINIFTGNL